MTRRLPLLLGALAFATAFKLGSGTAEANHWRFGGHASGHWSGTVHVGGSVHWSRPYWRSNYSVGGHIWVGGGYYYPRYYWYRPYYYYYYYPEYVPSYYYPVAPAPAAGPSTVAAIEPPRPLPTFGIGLFAGGISVDNTNGSAGSSDVGVLARLRLGGGGLLVEGELGKTSFDNDVRVDRRLGGSLIYEFGARNAFAPYVLGGLGVNQAQVGDGYNTTQDFAELGVGLRLALSRNIHITADIRAGSRNTVSSDSPTTIQSGAARTVSPPSTTDQSNESYTRGRLAAIIYF